MFLCMHIYNIQVYAHIHKYTYIETQRCVHVFIWQKTNFSDFKKQIWLYMLNDTTSQGKNTEKMHKTIFLILFSMKLKVMVDEGHTIE